MSKYFITTPKPEKPRQKFFKFKQFFNIVKKQSAYSRQASRQIMLQYALSLIIYPTVCIALFLLGTAGYYAYRRMTNDESSFVFWFAQVVRETLPIWIALTGIVGWVALTYYFVCKPLRYVDELIEAAEALSTPSETSIKLSPALSNVQDNLNLVRINL